ALAALLGSEGANGFIGFGQAREAQKRQRRLAFMLGFALFVDFHLTTGTDDDRFMGLVHGQHVQDIAERINLRTHRPWQSELPAKDLLALAVVWRQTQILNTGADLIL